MATPQEKGKIICQCAKVVCTGETNCPVKTAVTETVRRLGEPLHPDNPDHCNAVADTFYEQTHGLYMQNCAFSEEEERRRCCQRSVVKEFREIHASGICPDEATKDPQAPA